MLPVCADSPNQRERKEINHEKKTERRRDARALVHALLLPLDDQFDNKESEEEGVRATETEREKGTQQKRRQGGGPEWGMGGWGSGGLRF